MNKFNIENLDLFYGKNQALKKINLSIPNRQVTALIGSHQDVVNQHYYAA